MAGAVRIRRSARLADMILACLETQRLHLAHGAELASAVRQVLLFVADGIVRDEQRP
ncbi:Uncharacterised protein [Nocardia otitidiscaviarum]|uniref:Uncharacterized protein n=1 Tax=Nocardia otitidiscaviarum TaxID=1823 RepID=A0A378YFT3_9NOCA|nr:hypothetical protein [Nocardia otitidiscaviarum]SUA76046.1 Uncharacterised protein [Nocardia otitidiscaviarum]